MFYNCQCWWCFFWPVWWPRCFDLFTISGCRTNLPPPTTKVMRTISWAKLQKLKKPLLFLSSPQNQRRKCPITTYNDLTWLKKTPPQIEVMCKVETATNGELSDFAISFIQKNILGKDGWNPNHTVGSKKTLNRAGCHRLQWKGFAEAGFGQLMAPRLEIEQWSSHLHITQKNIAKMIWCFVSVHIFYSHIILWYYMCVYFHITVISV